MITILVVDDSPFERRLVGGLLTAGLAELDQPTDANILYAENGREALAVMSDRLPDMVLTDLQMPEMNGLELVETARTRHPAVPIVLMTAHGSEEIAALALRRGAASYVPKRNLAQDLIDTVTAILALGHDSQAEGRVRACLVRSEFEYVLTNDSSVVPPLVRCLCLQLTTSGICEESEGLRVSVALHEALVNAIEHGNLELRSELKDGDPNAFPRLAAQRRATAPFRDRRVYVTVRVSPDEVEYAIRDEGPGFSTQSLPDPTDPANLERAHGRGLLLIRTFMDDVRHNPAGNEVTLVKRRERQAVDS